MEFPVGDALKKIMEDDFKLKMGACDTVEGFIVMLMRDPTINVLKKEAEEQRGWQRLLARLRVLAAVPTIIGLTCEEDIPVAALLWLLRDCPLGEVPKLVELGTVWHWAPKIVKKENLA